MIDLAVQIIRSDNKVMYFDGKNSGSALWGIVEIEGIDSIDIEYSTEKQGVGVGEAITGVSVGSREIQITCEVKNRLNNENEDGKIKSFFNPLFNYDIYITKYTRQKWITAKFDNLETNYSNIVNQNAKFKITLICENPLFNSISNFGKSLTTVKGGFRFPYRYTKKNPINFGILKYISEGGIDNDGDYETYPKIQLNCITDVLNPKVFINGNYIGLKKDFKAGSVIEIDIERREIFCNGENHYRYIDRISTFRESVLRLGKNTINYSAESGLMNCTLFYYKKYLGV